MHLSVVSCNHQKTRNFDYHLHSSNKLTSVGKRGPAGKTGGLTSSTDVTDGSPSAKAVIVHHKTY